MNGPAGESYAFCEELARRTAGNFYPAFRVLPGPQRRAMCALYAFMRVTDDLSDETAPVDVKRDRLKAWRDDLHAAQTGVYRHELYPALHHTLTEYKVPVRFLEEVIDGVEMDLVVDRYATWDELRVYCYRVASAVGLACIHIWGFDDRDGKAKEYAEKAGYAFQLTNILRDLAEDADRGRVYLPQEDLDRFGYRIENLTGRVRNDAFVSLMRFEVSRARELYEASWPLAPMLAPAGRAVFLVMARTYRELLETIERRGYDVYSGRVRVGKWKKLLYAAQALPVRWGWV